MPAPNTAMHHMAYDNLMRDLLTKAAARIAAQAQSETAGGKPAATREGG